MVAVSEVAVYEKHCRYCNTRIAEDKGWMGNYCCEDHRTMFQDKQHHETVERLRREEQAESEFALHSFEPKRVRIAMLGGSDIGGSEVISRRGMSQEAAQPVYISRSMPPRMRVQPLVAPALQPKAPVELGLAALSFVAEPVSAPLEIPTGHMSRPPVPPSSLGATVRRAAVPTPASTPPTVRVPRKNDAIVNLIRGAKERMPQPGEIQVLGVPAGKPVPEPAPGGQPQVPGIAARIRPLAAGQPTQSNEAPASSRATAERAERTAAQVRTAIAAPQFLALNSSTTDRLQRMSLFAATGTLLLAGVVAYFLLTGR